MGASGSRPAAQGPASRVYPACGPRTDVIGELRHSGWQPPERRLRPPSSGPGSSITAATPDGEDDKPQAEDEERHKPDKPDEPSVRATRG